MLGLPPAISTCLFDLDGVLTDTASVHRTAWGQTFDELLQALDGDGFQRFSSTDYDRYVDGKSRVDGVRDFLLSRDVHLPDGDPDDPPDARTVYGVGNRKNELLLATLRNEGVQVYEGSRRYLEAARDAGLGRFVVSSSANTAEVLQVTGLADLVQGRVDGVTLREQKLPGKPAPDAFLAGARLAGVAPSAAVVFEDALAGVEAGRAGHFGYVVGVNRLDDQHGHELREHGASTVVRDLMELLP